MKSHPVILIDIHGFGSVLLRGIYILWDLTRDVYIKAAHYFHLPGGFGILKSKWSGWFVTKGIAWKEPCAYVQSHLNSTDAALHYFLDINIRESLFSLLFTFSLLSVFYYLFVQRWFLSTVYIYIFGLLKSRCFILSIVVYLLCIIFNFYCWLVICCM